MAFFWAHRGHVREDGHSWNHVCWSPAEGKRLVWKRCIWRRACVLFLQLPRTSCPHCFRRPLGSVCRSEAGLHSKCLPVGRVAWSPPHPVSLPSSDSWGTFPPVKPSVPSSIHTHHIPVDSGRGNPSFCKRHFKKHIPKPPTLWKSKILKLCNKLLCSWVFKPLHFKSDFFSNELQWVFQRVYSSSGFPVGFPVAFQRVFSSSELVYGSRSGRCHHDSPACGTMVANHVGYLGWVTTAANACLPFPKSKKGLPSFVDARPSCSVLLLQMALERTNLPLLLCVEIESGMAVSSTDNTPELNHNRRSVSGRPCVCGQHQELRIVCD